MTNLQPKMSLQNSVIDSLLTSIGKADKDYIKALVEDITEKNFVFTQNREGFIFGQTFYTSLPSKSIRTATKVPLDSSLYEDALSLVEASRELSQDTQRLRQGLTVVLRDYMNLQDVRDALPNFVRMVLPQLNHLDRTRKVAYTLQ